MGRLQANKGVSLRGSKRERQRPQSWWSRPSGNVCFPSHRRALVRGSSGADSSLGNRRGGGWGDVSDIRSQIQFQKHLPSCSPLPQKGEEGRSLCLPALGEAHLMTRLTPVPLTFLHMEPLHIALASLSPGPPPGREPRCPKAVVFLGLPVPNIPLGHRRPSKARALSFPSLHSQCP